MSVLNLIEGSCFDYECIVYRCFIVSGIEREEGELIQRFGRASTFTYNHHIHTHIHSHKHANGLYRSLKAVATNASAQERTKYKVLKHL